MLLGEVFDRFAAESPVRVMSHAAFEHALPAGMVDELFAEFAEHAERPYTRDLLFSQLVDLMGLVVSASSRRSTPPSASGRPPSG